MLADLRLALRMLAKAPAFATVTVLVLALGIGASTTTFSAINALLLKPWPYIKDQEQVAIRQRVFPEAVERGERRRVSGLPGFQA